MELRDVRSPRVHFQHPLRVRRADGKGPTRRLWAMNLSVNGMFIRSADPFPVGTRLRIELQWAGAVIPLPISEVMWSRGTGGDLVAGFGLQFVDVDPATRRLLDALVLQNGGAEALRAAREAPHRDDRTRDARNRERRREASLSAAG